jgi:hypothetical protein
MSNWNKLVAHDPVSRRNKHGNVVRGWLYDIDDILRPGRKVLREGIGATTLHVISVDKERSLVAIMEDGHSIHMNAMTGSRYFTSQILVYRYRTQVVGNEVHVILPYDRIFEFPLKEGAL